MNCVLFCLKKKKVICVSLYSNVLCFSVPVSKCYVTRSMRPFLEHFTEVLKMFGVSKTDVKSTFAWSHRYFTLSIRYPNPNFLLKLVFMFAKK